MSDVTIQADVVYIGCAKDEKSYKQKATEKADLKNLFSDYEAVVGLLRDHIARVDVGHDAEMKILEYLDKSLKLAIKIGRSGYPADSDGMLIRPQDF